MIVFDWPGRGNLSSSIFYFFCTGWFVLTDGFWLAGPWVSCFVPIFFLLTQATVLTDRLIDGLWWSRPWVSLSFQFFFFTTGYSDLASGLPESNGVRRVLAAFPLLGQQSSQRRRSVQQEGSARILQVLYWYAAVLCCTAALCCTAMLLCCCAAVLLCYAVPWCIFVYMRHVTRLCVTRCNEEFVKDEQRRLFLCMCVTKWKKRRLWETKWKRGVVCLPHVFYVRFYFLIYFILYYVILYCIILYYNILYYIIV